MERKGVTIPSFLLKQSETEEKRKPGPRDGAEKFSGWTVWEDSGAWNVGMQLYSKNFIRPHDGRRAEAKPQARRQVQ